LQQLVKVTYDFVAGGSSGLRLTCHDRSSFSMDWAAMRKPLGVDDDLVPFDSASDVTAPFTGFYSAARFIPAVAPTAAHGTDGNDFFHYWNDHLEPPPGYHDVPLSSGETLIYPKAGNDIVLCEGNGFIVNFGPYLTRADRVEGYGDTGIVLHGDYSAGLSLTSNTLDLVDEIDVQAGYSYKLTFDDTVNEAGLYFIVDGTKLRSGDTLTVNAAAESTHMYRLLGGAGNDYLVGGQGQNDIEGGAGNDVLKGGADRDFLVGGSGDDVLYGNGTGDDFELMDGGKDTAFGGPGDDVFNLSATSFNAQDYIDGGPGQDTISFFETVTDKVLLSGANLVSIETIDLSPGAFYTDDSLVAAGKRLWVNDRDLSSSGAHVTFDGSAETDGYFLFWGGEDSAEGGPASETFIGGNKDDIFNMANNVAAADHIDGGPGSDTLILSFGPNIVFTDSMMVNVETIQIVEDDNYHPGASLTMSDGNVAAGGSLTVDGSALYFGGLIFDGSQETDGRFILIGGARNDSLVGGAQADRIKGGSGNDTMEGGLGADKLDGGDGMDVFVYSAVADSTSRNFDRVLHFDSANDTFDLPFGVSGIDATIMTGKLSTSRHFDGQLSHAVGPDQLAAHYAVLFTPDSGTLQGDILLVVDGNGMAGYQAGQDLVIMFSAPVDLTHLSVSNFT
jgi:Ca2+-binding RTX toxin-like protein